MHIKVVEENNNKLIKYFKAVEDHKIKKEKEFIYQIKITNHLKYH
jgi:hypothetical protein